MSAPQLTVYSDGAGTVSGDGLNTFVQSADSMSQLRSFVGIQGVQVFVRGTSTPGDGGEGNFYWNANGTAPDDNGLTTVVPPGSGSGVWTRLPFFAAGIRETVNPGAPPSTTSQSGVMAGLGISFTPQTTGKVLVLISGTMSNNTAGGGGRVEGTYAVGAPPVAGASGTGNAMALPQLGVSGVANATLPFTVQGLLSLTPGTGYWVDLEYNVNTGSGTLTLSNITATLIEV